MTQFESVRKVVDDYVETNGTDTILSKEDMYVLIHKSYPTIPATSIQLTDFCYNRYNAGIEKDFAHGKCLEYTCNGKYKLLGTSYQYNGPVFQYMGRKNEVMIGTWVKGKFQKEIKY